MLRRFESIAISAVFGLIAFGLATAPGPPAHGQDGEIDFDSARDLMVQMIEIEVLLSSGTTRIEQIDPRVLGAMAKVPRHAFVPSELEAYAYGNHPLPVGHEQNLAAPFLVALMTHLVEPEAGDVVYETGTGAGYHAAVLAHLVDRVYSVEVVEPLAMSAAAKLKRLGYDQVWVKPGDGYYGWAAKGPFDAIIVKEALDHVPPPLLDQLKPGGRLVIPLGSEFNGQHLTVIEKTLDGKIEKRRVLPVRFSVMQGGERT